MDLKAGTVAVYRSVRVKGDTKTRKSRRVLKLPTSAVHALRQHHARQAAERLAAGEMWQERDLVLGTHRFTVIHQRGHREAATPAPAAGTT